LAGAESHKFPRGIEHMKQINVGLSSWIIQDGNYDDFRVDQEASFALEFYPHSIGPSNRTLVTATNIDASRYQICGNVIYQAKEAWVIDVGVLAYQEGAPPENIKQGDDVEGEIYIGIDPFFYFEDLYKLPGMPTLTYKFRIKCILLETTPWLESTDETGRKVLARDATKESYREVSQTNAWEDDNGHGHYILKCEFAATAQNV
jgi:hypothetical protein